METPVGKCLSCGKMINMWRCGDVPGGGTYHVVCFECSEKDSRHGAPWSGLWRWVVGWMFGTVFIVGTFLVVLVFGGR